jgi:hypothetical protein
LQHLQNHLVRTLIRHVPRCQAMNVGETSEQVQVLHNSLTCLKSQGRLRHV